MTGEMRDQSNKHALMTIERIAESNAGTPIRPANRLPLTCGNALRLSSRLPCLLASLVSSTSKRLINLGPVSDPSSRVRSLTNLSNIPLSNMPVSSANMQNARRTRRRSTSGEPYP